MRWLAWAIAFGLPAAGHAAPTDGADARDEAYLGARGPELGDVVVHGSLGAALVLPHITLGVRAGLGAGFAADAAYRNLGFFGQSGRFRLLWGMRVAEGIDVGVAYRTSYSTLELADGDLIDIEFSSFPLGNDWEMGNAFVITFQRPGQAHITASLGPTYTLGGIRYVGFERRADGFELDPAMRGVEASVQGEWKLWERTNVFARFDALALVGLEKDEACLRAGQDNCRQLVPLGFIPTATLGLGWSP